jgi:serine phosphatase RsbU (regulator of sigma subunit)/anti-sigma regulatory factor (Ser/Thr protein kinase)
MTAFAQTLRRVILRQERVAKTATRPAEPLPGEAELRSLEAPLVEIAPNDPIVAYFQSAQGAVDVAALELESPAVQALRKGGVKLVVPLVSQGELIGLLNLGPRLSDQAYSSDDRRLLDNLAAQAAPAVRVGQLVREQETEVRARERLEQELEVARLIQQNFLPKELPELEGWKLAAFYRPARAVGGDFYDFIELPEGRLGLVVGDVTDKGVPAAMVMAATRSVLRASAQRLGSPGEVLERVNELLCPDMPPKMFVTCFYGVLDPASGRFHYANAGHSLPYARTAERVRELRATGMPLGLLPGMTYEEKEAVLAPGESVLLHSDGVVEAHNTEREMFGSPRLSELVSKRPGGTQLIDLLLTELDAFTGAGWEQEDDITLVTLQRATRVRTASTGARNGQVLAEFEVASEPGNEREVMTRVVDAVQELELAESRLERLKTAVAEAAMNAIEHGNEGRAELPVTVEVVASDAELRIRITDQGGGPDMPQAETPDLEAKLAGLQKPRGWGLFLIENMVDELQVSEDGTHRTVELVLHLKGGQNAGEPL